MRKYENGLKKMVNPTRGNDVDIIVEHLPDKFVRDDWS